MSLTRLLWFVWAAGACVPAGARAELAGLDDAARRERAAGLALKFLALMGGDGDGEEDEDEEGTEGSEQ